MKKKFALALAMAFMLTILTGCRGGNNPPSTSGSAENPPGQAVNLKVGVFYYDFSDVYISKVRSSMDQALTELVGKGNFTNYDAAGSQPTQTDQVTTALTAGCNLLIVNIVETSSPDAAIGIRDAAADRGIPVIFFNREVSDDVVNGYDKCAFVGTNAPDAGHMQGQMIGQFLVDHYDDVDLNGDGTISYVMFKGQEANAEAEARTQFSVEDANALLTEAGKPQLAYYDASASTKYLVDVNGKWSAQAANDYMNGILSTYTQSNGNMVELVICNNDAMAEGAISALQQSGYNNGQGTTVIPVFGVDASDSARALIAAGNMVGSIRQDAQGMADAIAALVSNTQSGTDLMTNINAERGYTVDLNEDGTIRAAKIRIPYHIYTGEQ